jgi:hypothetical protein
MTTQSQALRVAGEAAERLAARGITCKLEKFGPGIGPYWVLAPKGCRAVTVGPDDDVATVIAGACDNAT